MARKSDYLYHPANTKSDATYKDRGSGCCDVAQLKFSLYLFNILFLVTGAILLAIGLWTFLEKHPSLILLTAGLYDVTAIVLMFAGKFFVLRKVYKRNVKKEK